MPAESPEEIALADTIGAGTPWEAGDLFGKLGALLGGRIPMRAHFHNTRGTGIANAWEAYKAGVRIFDASLGGLGGCPFAPRATGNIATEDLIYMMGRSGVETGIDLDAAIAANKWFAQVLGRELPSAVARAASPLTSAHATRAPCRAAAPATARPMPEPAPMITTVLPSNRNKSLIAKIRLSAARPA